MEKVGVMELQECEITEKSTGASCLTTPWVMKAFAEFYGKRCLPQDINSPGVIRMSGDTHFDSDVYTKRIQVTAETFLLEASSRGRRREKDVHAHVVGLGLGVWSKYDQLQTRLFLQAFRNALETLSGQLTNLKTVDFSWIRQEGEDDLKHGQNVGGVNVTFSMRNPFEPLPSADGKTLIVAMYAWDGNSLPGNEY